MPRSASSLMRAGAISAKALNSTLAKTRAQKTRMANFDSRQRDEGDKENDGVVRIDHIDNKEFQRVGSRETASGKPSRGGQARGGTEPRRDQIDQAPMQRKKFPAGHRMKGKGNKSGPAGHVGVKGGVVQSGPEYGGGGRNTQ